jgi:pimeloyl-ACP methyl ester carboxylesterase
MTISPLRSILLLLALLIVAAAPRPTREIAPYRLTVPGGGVMPLYATADPDHPPPGITRVVLVLHGLGRDADFYFRTAEAARDAAGSAGTSTLMIAPQVLADEDVAAHHLPPEFLHWTWDRWAGGDAANGPTPVSLFDAYDALLSRFTDHQRFPGLRNVVIAGHSAGGQIAQRYTVVGNGPDTLQRAGIAVRFIIANPSSYIWFSPERPLAGGGFGIPPQAASCPHYADWRYGLTGTLPPYVTGTPVALEARYIARDVVYLLGTSDIDPNQSDLDKSCAGETQGPTRYARGHAYFAYLQAREGATLHHREYDVPGVAHSGRGMLTSACAVAFMFDAPGCPDSK